MAPVVDMEALHRFIETVGVKLEPWQLAALEAVWSGNELRLEQHKRSHGRAYVDRLAKDAYRALGWKISEHPGYWTASAPVAD